MTASLKASSDFFSMTPFGKEFQSLIVRSIQYSEDDYRTGCRNVNNNSPIQDYVHPDYQTQPFEMTPGFKPFTIKLCWYLLVLALT